MKIECINVFENTSLIHDILATYQAGNTSLFLSQEWVSAWLDHAPSDIPTRNNLLFITGTKSDFEHASFFLGHEPDARGPLFSRKKIFLNCMGDNYYDQKIYIEYNGLLRNGENFPLENVIRSIRPEWEEFYLPGILESEMEKLQIYALAKKSGFNIKQSSSPVYGVDFEKIRTQDYMTILGSRTRARIRQTEKLLKQNHGPITIRIAQTKEEACSFFHSLVRLHNEKRNDGAFSPKVLLNLHQDFIVKNSFPKKTLLLQIKSGEDDVGYIYGIIHNGIIHMYQHGINYQLKEMGRMSLVLYSHYKASMALKDWVGENGECYHLYDFMAGEERYKKELSTQTQQMYWVTIQKRKWKFEIENQLSRLKAWFKVKFQKQGASHDIS